MLLDNRHYNFTHDMFPPQAKTKGCQPRVDIGVKYADKQERLFDEEKMKAGQCVIGLQVPALRFK